MADKITMIYFGRVVEYRPAKKVFENPAHLYTNTLFI
jgi:ABC-type dipeptide/oligopeptide/nickel transport system ATPase component